MRRIIIGLAVLGLIWLLAGTPVVLSNMPPALLQENPEKPPLPTATPESVPAPVEIREAPVSPVDLAIHQAFQARVRDRGDQAQVLGLLLFEPVIDHIQQSQDGSAALVWVGFIDPETGEVVATEPGISIARSLESAPREDPAAWAITLPSDGDWPEKIQSLPQDLITDDMRMWFLQDSALAGDPEAAALQVFTGYKLPWPAGLEKRVTNSIGHYIDWYGDGSYGYCQSCRYAFDFADGTMFPLLAAKGGTVKFAKWTCANGDPNCTNYLILEDQSTIPTTYQVYYHLAYNSIPQQFRVVGTPVRQGEYIGDVDDTGASTGHHLHYHIYLTPTSANWSWGTSVDFTFDDVADNGGRPRACYEAQRRPDLGAQCQLNNRYRSGNTPAFPPSASLSAPADRLVITGQTVTVSGSASDDISVKRIQVLANYDGVWKSISDITPSGNGPFSKAVDLCASGLEVPDGPFGLTVRVYDYEGSQASGLPVRQLIKNHACGSPAPPPASACAPSANQVALYADPDYRGACSRFDLNSSQGYKASALGTVGENKASSIQVGSSVRAVLYDWDIDVGSSMPIGRIETLEKNDASLADNLIGSDRISGLWVYPRTELPDEPFFNQPIGSSLAGANPTSFESLVLAWEGGAGATSYDVTLSGPGANWTKNTVSNSLSIGNLAAGSYSLTVGAKNTAGRNNSTKPFTVSSASLPSASTRSLPFLDDLEAGPGDWVAAGLWRHGSITVGTGGATKAWIYNDGTDYNSGTWRAGDLTSPPIAVPASGAYYLRFSYFMDVEDGYGLWDQRRVQVSVNGGPFTDLHILSDDKQAAQDWLNSGPINLSGFAGKTIRLRFHFNTIDEENNGGKGWIIDNVTVNSTAPNTTCGDTNDSPASATAISLNSTTSGTICPERDIDYYKFTGTAGQILNIDIDARSLSPASKLDSNTFLLDADGRSVIAENDDEKYAVLVDSMFSYTLSRSGTYFIKVKAWNHPGVGSTDHFYKLKLTNPNTPLPPKSVSILYPPNRTLVPGNPFEISVNALDYDSGQVAQVDFFWHGPDWSTPNWVKLTSDTDGSNGWTLILDPLQYGAVNGSALYVQARSRTGGIRGLAWWDLVQDQTIPTSHLNGQASLSTTTALQLSWTASDPINDIVSFELQYQENAGTWKNWSGNPIGKDVRSTWFVGKPGVKYGFRMRAIDLAGNVEALPAQAETSSTVEAVCTADPSEASSTAIGNSRRVTRNAMTSNYSLCNASQPGAADADWLSFQAQKGEKLLLWVKTAGGGAGFKVTLYKDAATSLQSWQSIGFATDVNGVWTAPETGIYYLKIEPFRSDLLGTTVYYQFWHGLANSIYLPILVR